MTSSSIPLLPKMVSQSALERLTSTRNQNDANSSSCNNLASRSLIMEGGGSSNQTQSNNPSNSAMNIQNQNYSKINSNI